jgi:Ca-activated chloride channel family protein
MEFARQEYFWLLLLVPFLVLLWGIGVWHLRRMRIRFGNIGNLASISRISWSGREWFRGLLFVAAMGLMVLALAEPSAVVRELHAVPTPTDLVFLLDTSPSMYGRDMDPSRLGRAERIIERFIFLKQPEDRYGLISFNWTSVVLSYMTRDPQSILLYFDYLNNQNLPKPGTNVGAVLKNAMQLVETERTVDPEGAQNRRVVFVLVSDGDDTAGEIEGPLAEVIRSGIKIYSIGLGTANGSNVPMEMAGGLNGRPVRYYQTYDGVRLISQAQARSMREVSDKTGGRFVRGELEEEVNQVIEEILVDSRPVSGFESSPVRRDLYFYFLMAALGCLLVGVFL